jgi:putative ABC transport system ATP-binding protein
MIALCFLKIRGPSGGGKTTMLNILGTIDKPTSGTVNLFGRMITSQSTDSELARLRLESIGLLLYSVFVIRTGTSPLLGSCLRVLCLFSVS